MARLQADISHPGVRLRLNMHGYTEAYFAKHKVKKEGFAVKEEKGNSAV